MNYYDVFPLVVPSNQSCEIRIRPRFEHAFFPAAENLTVVHLSVDGLEFHRESGEALWEPSENQIQSWQLAADGTLHIQSMFLGEQEHIIQVKIRNPQDSGIKTIRSFRVYSVEPDLYALRPLKGDFHIHTNRSDGRECPCYVAARYRQAGFDFAAISDHMRYAPSLEAKEYWENLVPDFKLYPGEEVHATGNPVHIINFGSSFSVNQKCFNDEETYRREVQRYLQDIPQQVPGLDYFPVASSEWVFDQIRAGGGLAVFCHPYWYTTRYVINEGLISEIFRRRRFDAFELLGGFYRHQPRSNNYQVLRWCEERSRGNRFPVVGLSDSHGTDLFPLSKLGIDSSLGISYTQSRDADLFNWYYTIVLAKENSVPAIIEAIRNHHCAAIDAPAGERPNVYGDFRIGKYVNFLLREYFPVHQNFCQEEGSLMLDYLAGEKEMGTVLQSLSGRSTRFREACFCPSKV
ncbi:MAG: hypothetical protein GX927_12885 [Lentisphaerae bacterium]|nr:hypothetical protein [Lentisphaerota bacterium]